MKLKNNSFDNSFTYISPLPCNKGNERWINYYDIYMY